MKKIIIAALIIASFGAGAFLGSKLFAQAAQPVAYQETAQEIVSSLSDTAFLEELQACAKESKHAIRKFGFQLLKNNRLTEKELQRIQLCINGYQELNTLFDHVNILLVQQAWQNVAWHIVDGNIAVDPASLNAAARKLAKQDSAIAPRLKKFAQLNVQWADSIFKSIESLRNSQERKSASLFFAYSNFNLSMYRIIKKYPRVQALCYKIHACLQWPHMQQLFALALKDELINRMPEWLPVTWPYAKEGMQELGVMFNTLLNKQIKYVVQQAHKNNSAQEVLDDEDEE